MLRRFRVKNFRNFNESFEFDFRTDRQYEFNTHAIHDGCVRHGMLYSHNGGGKSNLGLAMLDITSHLNDAIHTIPSLVENYHNADSGSDISEFEYEFCFDQKTVVYTYRKTDLLTTLSERLTIDNKVCIEIDRTQSTKAHFNLPGAESLKQDLKNTQISAVKYVKANSVLDDTPITQVFYRWITWVEGMVFFRSLKSTAESHGQGIGVKRLSQAIIQAGKLKDFESFLNDSGIECQLSVSGENPGDEQIDFVFDHRRLAFSQVASTGTLSLGIFYYWWLKLQKNTLSFAYIDEFDAFYHQSLSRSLVQKLSQLNCQTLLTTHNTSIMSNDLLRPDCYFILDKNKLFRFDDIVDKELRKAHNLEKIYKGLL